MVNSSKRFFFDDKFSDDPSLPKILNVTLANEMYTFNVIGEKTIIEDQIQGRDEPYLYNVDLKPLEFTMTIAFENYETIDEVSKVIKWLYNPKTYKRLSFDDMENNFFVIFIGSPEYYYVGNNNVGFNKYIGYITCTVRANAPYGYTDILTDTNNTGDLEVYPSFSIENIETALQGTNFNWSLIEFEVLGTIESDLIIQLPQNTYQVIKINNTDVDIADSRFNNSNKTFTLSISDLTQLGVGIHTIRFREKHIFTIQLSLLEILKYNGTGVPGANFFPETSWPKSKIITIDSRTVNIDMRPYHLGDLYTDNNTGKVYRYSYIGVPDDPTSINKHITLFLNTNANSGYF
jgi:hypothetical protein